MNSDSDNFTRSLGLIHLTASGIGVIIGAGIYILIGPATERAGGLVWASMLLASALCALTAFSYMELTSMFPKAGSEHEFARQVFPNWISFTTGWGMTIALIVASSAVSLGFARYLREFISINEHVASLILLLCVCILSLAGMQHVRWLVILFSVVQVGGLVGIVIVGAHHIGDVSLTSGNSFSGVLSGASIIFFAYIGFDEVITLAEETKDPHRTVPLALMWALCISTLLYVLVAIVAVNVLGVTTLAGSAHPLTDVMRESIGGASVKVIGVVALATTANTTLIASAAAARMMYSMGDTGVISPRWAKVHKKQTPRTATFAVVAVSGALSLMGGLELLAEATNALVYFMFLMVNAIVIILRIQQPTTPRPFRVSFSVARIPVIPCLGIVATLAMSLQLEIRPVFAAIALLACGLVLYFIDSKNR
jgi:APA family basic amino acid/polyamine antiporter